MTSALEMTKMVDCCATCAFHECQKGYLYPHRCKKHKGERFSEAEWRRIVYSLYKCGEFKSIDAVSDVADREREHERCH